MKLDNWGESNKTDAFAGTLLAEVFSVIRIVPFQSLLCGVKPQRLQKVSRSLHVQLQSHSMHSVDKLKTVSPET